MARAFALAAFFATVIERAASAPAPDSEGDAASWPRNDADETCMLQQVAHSRTNTAATQSVTISHATWRLEQKTTSAKEVFATVHGVIGSAKAKMAATSNRTRGAEAYGRALQRELVPKVRAAALELERLKDAQQAIVKQCDTNLQADQQSQRDLQHAFRQKSSALQACAAEERNHLQKWSSATAYAAQAAACENLRGEVDAAACSHASHAQGLCESYEDCRCAKTKVQCYRTQLLEAHQSQCISSALVLAAGDVESLVRHLGDCEASTKPSFETIGAMPPPMACQDAVTSSCLDGFLELHVGADETWSVPCGACPAITLGQSAFTRVSIEASADASADVSTEASIEASTETSIETSTETSAEALAETSPMTSAKTFTQAYIKVYKSLRARFMIWLPEATILKNHFWIAVNPRHRSAMNFQLIEYGSKTMGSKTADSETITHTASEFIAPVILIAVGIPLAVLAVSCFIADSLPAAVHGPARGGSQPVKAESKPNPMNPMSPQNFSTPKLPVQSVRGGSSPYTKPCEHYSMSQGGSLMPSANSNKAEMFDLSRGGSLVPSMRPSFIGGTPHNPPDVYSMSRGGSLMPSMRPSLVNVHSHGIAVTGLCPELNVPTGNECIVGMPSLVDSKPGEVLLKNIVDKGGQPLLYAGVTSAPAGGEYVFLAKKTRGTSDSPQERQELAFCETGGVVRAQGWLGKIFSWEGELYAQVREAMADDEVRRSSVGPSGVSPRMSMTGPNKSYIIVSAAGPPWELRVQGNFKERKLTIEDGNKQTVAMVSPGYDLGLASASAHDFYRLRLGPGANSCTVMLALLTIERLLGLSGGNARALV